jgi:hypothetical protein
MSIVTESQLEWSGMTDKEKALSFGLCPYEFVLFWVQDIGQSLMQSEASR